MCGIVGYVGDAQAQPVLLAGLKRLEYRGYDSAGVAVQEGASLAVRRRVGKLAVLRELLESEPVTGTTGIGHTRWATHGPPNEANAHPHVDGDHRLAVVHNGIIENHTVLREALRAEGVHFRSDTDTEVLSHLIRKHYAGDLFEAVRQALVQVEGAYALAVVCVEEPGVLVVARHGSPLVIGVGTDAHYAASDVLPLLPHTRQVVYLNNGHVARLTKESFSVQDLQGAVVNLSVQDVSLQAGGEDSWEAVAEKEGFPHFMLKEIHQQPAVIEHALVTYTNATGVEIQFPDLGALDAMLPQLRRIVIVACGTAWHAGLVGKYLLEHFARLPVEVDLASEYRYRDPVLDPETLVIAVSQSGETADTLEAVRQANAAGAPVLGLVNVAGSSIAREATGLIYLQAGPEIGVASTKAYTAQITLLALLALLLGQRRGTVSEAVLIEHLGYLRDVPKQIQQCLDSQKTVSAVAALPRYRDAGNAMFIGRGVNYPSALEGALKLKEISYIHVEGYAAGEMKHGPIALVTDGIPVVAIALQGSVYPKLLSNIEEIRARDGHILAIATEGDRQIAAIADDVIHVPPCPEVFSPLVAAVPLQLFAYFVAVRLGRDVDQPRNLAKSVTVE